MTKFNILFLSLITLSIMGVTPAAQAQSPMQIISSQEKEQSKKDFDFGMGRPYLNQAELKRVEAQKQMSELEMQRRAEVVARDRLEKQSTQVQLERDQNRQIEEALESEEQKQQQGDLYSTPELLSGLPGPVAPKSQIEEVFSGRFPEMGERELRQFGYELFNQKPVTFTPLEDVPVNYDYVVGPGDVFTINVWGSANFAHTVKVNREGTIFIPKVGTIKVWGQSFGQMAKKVRSRLSNFFSGIKVDIALETIRMIDVFIIGEVERPGTYSIPSTATPINALFYAGGATKRGSMRKVKVLRNNKEIAEVDLYDFLVGGVHKKQKLQSQDVILVPVIGKVAAVSGQVKRPAIYEVTDKTTIFDTLELAGGLSFAGTVGRISVERVLDNKERIVTDYTIPENISEISRKDAVAGELGAKIEDGDFITIFPVLDEFRSTVFLNGHAKRPGKYEFKQGMRIKDLIPSFEVLGSDPYEQFVQVVRTVPPKDTKVSLFSNLKAAIEGDEDANLELQERDEVYVFSKEELNLRDQVSIEGKVNRPGEYLYFPGMTLKDLVFMAGNLTMDAYMANAEVARYTVTPQGLKFDRMIVDLGDALSKAPMKNPELQPKDSVFIRGMPDWELENHITLNGEVMFPGRYSYFKDERLSSVIQRAGGFTKRAFLKGAVFTRRSVRELQKRNLREQIRRLEEAIQQQMISSRDIGEEADRVSANQALAAQKALLRNLEEAEVTGRLVIGLDKLRDFKGSKHDVFLEPGDALSIPPMPTVVTVMGEVYSPTSFVYESGRDVGYYLQKAGGPTINGDTDSIFIIKADGSVVSRRQGRGFLLRSFYQHRIDRGDAILVPKDISRFSWLQTTKDITDIIFKIASTTGITIQAFK